MRALLFNPENDLALAADERNYTPKANALALHRAGALLPAWWAQEGDIIIAPDSLKDELEQVKRRFGLHGEIATPETVSRVDCALPWGWSLDAKRQFLDVGIPDEILPDDSSLDRWRLLSHRRTATNINAMISKLCPRLRFPEPAVETTEASVAVEMERRSPGCYVKSPWSSSGRGVFCAREMSPETLRRQVEGIIRRQGSVIVERGLDRVMDFAMLYYCEGGGARRVGSSVFRTYGRCAYAGNIVAPDHVLLGMIAECVGRDSLEEVVKAQNHAVNSVIAPFYEGWLGVDMLAYRRDGEILIAPCVEVNLRMTMGVTAMYLQRRLEVSSPRLFSIGFGASTHDGYDILPPRHGFRFTLK